MMSECWLSFARSARGALHASSRRLAWSSESRIPASSESERMHTGARDGAWPDRIACGILDRRALLALMVLTAACGDAEPVEDARQSAVFTEPAACSAAMLTGACRGPWAFILYSNPCYNLRTDPRCQQVLGQCHPSCLHAELGLSDSQSQSITCSNCTSSVLEANCNGRASAYLNSVAGNRAQVIPSHHLSEVSREGIRWEAQCDMRSEERRVGKECRSRWSPY